VSKRTSFSPSKAAKAALGTNGFVGHTRALLESAAWQRRSIHLVRVLDRLELEHLAHAGKENGFLKVTFDQFAKAGVSIRFIKPALAEGVGRGLIKITHQGGYAGNGRRDPSTYQLTYLSWKFIPAVGAPQYLEPTNEWKQLPGAKPLRQKPARANTTVIPFPKKKDRRQMTKRERERERYLKVNTGLDNAVERWNQYEQLILAKYGGDDIEKAWKTRDLAH
jgi:hypothetical protein